MHDEALAFLTHAAAYVHRAWCDDISAGGGAQQHRVLELGSRNINGGARPMFPSTEYVGVDLVDGDGVEVVANVCNPYVLEDASWRYPQYNLKHPFDLVVCTEVLEHVKEWQRFLRVAHEALWPGGFLVVTCAAVGREPHSTEGVVGVVPEGEHYANLQPLHLWQRLARFYVLDFEYHAEPGDLYVLARKR